MPSQFAPGRLLSPGALWLLLRQKYRYGPKVAYYRDRVRPQILMTAPVAFPDTGACEIHVLTCASDWLNLIWALKSLCGLGRCAYPLCIHEDGSLGDEQIPMLRHHFPGARLITRAEADERQAQNLAAYPLSQRFRAANPLALKILDFKAFLQSPRMLLLDSDVLFFARPDALFQRLENPQYKLNSLNKDWNYGYSIDLEQPEVRDLPFQLLPLINSGLGLIHADSIQFGWIEEWLKLPSMMSHHHRIEQTLFALCSSRYGFEFLPAEYDVHLGTFDDKLPLRHFTGPIRHRLYSNGIRCLAKMGMLESA